MTKIRLYLMGEKGLHILKSLKNEFGINIIECVISEKDRNMLNDYYNDIQSFCSENEISFFKRAHNIDTRVDYSFAIGWQYLISNEEKLIIFHDSILPRYRGFNPLVTALINGDKEIGATALFATSNYDCGDIVEQKKISIDYPIKISEAIYKMKFIYSDIAKDIVEKILKGNEITAIKQDESLATYSLWRDDLDYFIDWNWDASRIYRLIESVGAPYQGAQTYANGIQVVINQAVSLPDIVIENRAVGKVIMIDNSFPVVVCGSGLLKILDAKIFASDESLLPLKKFRTRFHNIYNMKRNQ